MGVSFAFPIFYILKIFAIYVYIWKMIYNWLSCFTGFAIVSHPGACEMVVMTDWMTTELELVSVFFLKIEMVAKKKATVTISVLFSWRTVNNIQVNFHDFTVQLRSSNGFPKFPLQN